MTSNLADLIARLRLRLNDVDDSINSTLLTGAIKDSITFVAKATECFIKTEPLSPSSNTVTLSDDFITIQSVKDTTTTPNTTIRPSNSREYDEMDGELNCWLIINDALYTTKTTGSHYTGIRVTYSYVPDITTDSINEKFVPAILAYALYRFRDAERDSGLADRAFAELAILTGIEVIKRDETTLNLSQG